MNTCLKSLRAADYESYRDELYFHRHEGTCTWVSNDPRYRTWIEQSDKPVLWVHGDPGVGKSVLSAVLTREVSNDLQNHHGRHCTVAYFFCDDRDARLSSADAILANLLAQLLKQKSKVFGHFEQEWEFTVNGERTVWSFGMLWRVFERILKDEKIGILCLLIDGLDECEIDSRRKLLTRLQHLLNKHPDISKRVKILLTSRPHVQVKSTLAHVTDISLDGHSLNRDITTFVTAEVSKLPQYSPGLREEIQHALINGANGMFLWVALILDDLQKSTTTKPRVCREKLRSLPKSLPDVYRNILRKINREDQPAANTILQWVVWAIRPLSLEELRVAIAIDIKDTCMSSLYDEME
ncbi:hypothetical protein K440DRAFT_38583 [Wilcoxina mikolae CBS 423.85]|nr:hypothetical protein K440DRAFT_38583 [Wilcoxina mikolae CBS 423.85]